MRIQIAVQEEDHDTLTDLYRWLRQDPDLRQHAKIELNPAVAAGAMGTVDVIDLILSQGFSALNLALSYSAWRHARRAPAPVTLIVTGEPLTLADGSEETVQRIAEALRAAQRRVPEND
ncbi:effector-associated constant component EACC1 [Streptomyces sp. HD]|uniref:effector-associated constant component EACC1 n=1 Tax=Streptomyces sp. HD TaxID=3020892 RepID=UPI00232B97C1|nr:hypothetical protein [Streptomyces sp. HD]MDC0771720.1 hypothetical protein [Streptomyces sp. HD]